MSPTFVVHAQGVEWGRGILSQSSDWYETDEALTIADNILQYQSREGGWPKNVDKTVWPPLPQDAKFATDGKANTFDNDATSTELEYLARIISAGGGDKYRKSFDRGLNYVFEAQYDNGGWPQYYPLREGYYTHITFNDDAMVRILSLLKEVEAGTAHYKFVSDQQKELAKKALDAGIDVILKTQIRQNGKLTGWCAQYDEQTLKPAWARAYEPPSISGNETVGILRFLMEIEKPTPEVQDAIEGGVNWLKTVVISGYRFESFVNQDGERDRHIVPDVKAGPLWARFYELVSDRPLFLGRDSVYRYTFSEIERERRVGYSYYGTWPEELIEVEFPQWQDMQ